MPKLLCTSHISIAISVSLGEVTTTLVFSVFGGQSDYPRTPQDSIICMFNILYERVDDGLVLVCWCIN